MSTDHRTNHATNSPQDVALPVEVFAEAKADIAYIRSLAADNTAIMELYRAPFDTAKATPLESAISGDELLRKIAALVGGDTAMKIVAIAHSKITIDQRQREIYALDRTAAGWTSTRWAELLGEGDRACRSTTWWTTDRPGLLRV
jgi:hypothetical protein